MSNELVVTGRVKQYVKEYLSKTGKKQWKLACELGYEPKKFSQLINGRVPMGIDDLSNICDFFEEPATTFIPFRNSTNLQERK